MAQQISKKFFKDGSVDGDKIKLLKGQSIKGQNESGQEVDLLKLDANGKVILNGQEAAVKSEVDSGISAEVSRAQGEEARIEGKVNAEVSRAESEEARIEGKVDAEVSARQSAISGVESSLSAEALARQTAISSVESALSSEVSARQSADAQVLVDSKSYTDQKIAEIPAVDLSGYYTKSEVDSQEAALDQKISTEKGRIDAILSASTADADSFKEIVDLINSVDTTNDQAFAGYVSSNNAAVSDLGSRLDVVEPKVTTLQSSLSSEVSARQSADSALQSSITSLGGRLDIAEPKIATLESGLASELSTRAAADLALGARLDNVETINGFIRGSIYNDSASVYADGRPGSEDPAALTRDGWYFQNTVAGQGISWYYHDGINYPTTKAQLKNTFAVMTFDDKTAKPIFGVYTMPTGSGDIMPGFAHSKFVYQVPTASMTNVVLGKKYLVYAGDVAPTAHPELPRLQATFVAGSSGGQMLSSEYISTISLISDGTVAVNKVKWLVESVGVHSDACKLEGKLVIRYAQKANLDAEITARQSAISSVQSSVSTEVSRAIAAESALSTRVSANESSITSINSSLLTKAAITYVDSQDAAKLAEAKSYTDSKISELINGAPAALDTLKEIADQMASDESAAVALTTALASEVSRAKSEEARIEGKVDAEVVARQSAVSAEASRAQAAEQAIATDVLDLEAYAQDIRSDLDKELLDRASADAALSSRVSVLESKPAVTFEQAKIVLGENLAYVDLPMLAIENSICAFVGRLAIHKDDDFSVSVVNGVTRLTFIGSLQSPTGAENVEAGDVIRVVYAVLA